MTYTNTNTAVGTGTSDEPFLEFGHRKALAAEENLPAAWGARANINVGHVGYPNPDRPSEILDIPPGRGCFTYRDERAKEALKTLLDDCGVLKMIEEKYAELVRAGEIKHDEATEVVLHDSRAVRVTGSTNASYGYFYMTAVLKTEAFDPPAETSFDETGPDIITWSASRLPEVGERIMVDMNRIGAATVVGYAYDRFDVSNYLYILVRPDDPPDWWKDQRERESREKEWPFHAHIMGREWSELPESSG
jgi:hypothetical protein